METQDTNNQNIENRRRRHQSGRAMGGLIIIAIGTLLLARQVGAEIPSWVFDWPMILIAVGIYTGARHSFHGFGWMIPIGIGSAFLIDHELGISIGQMVWPIIIICIGLAMIFRPKKRDYTDRWRRWERKYGSEQSSEDILDATTIFGGIKKKIITKEFKGGDITTFFGGTDLDLMQADMEERAVVDITQIFGGTKLIVPPHWQIQSDDMVCIFGSIEDKRPIRNDINLDKKVLVLKGTCIFGGIDIKSY